MTKIIIVIVLLCIVILGASTLLPSSSKSTKASLIRVENTNNLSASDSSIPVKTQSRSTDNHYYQPKFSFGANVTYSQRYRKCLGIKQQKSQEERTSFFKSLYDKMMIVTTKPSPKYNELVLLRIHKRKFTLDFWLNICSLITEVVSPERELQQISRHIFLFTLVGHESAVPEEFKIFIRPHDEETLVKKYTDEIYTGGYERGGDLASADFLMGQKDSSVTTGVEYDFVWSIEHDVRFAGSSWSDLFYASRFVIGTMRKDLLEEGNNNPAQVLEATDHPLQYRHEFKCYRDLKNRTSGSVSDSFDEKELPHLVFFYPPIYNTGRFNLGAKRLQDLHDKERKFPKLVPSPNTWHFSEDKYFRGSWKSAIKSKTNELWIGSLMPIFGMSKKLAEKIVRDGLAGNSHVNQEVVLPLTAKVEKLKMITTHGCFPSQYYFAFERRRETSPVYVEWASSVLANESGTSEADVRQFKSSVHVPQIGFDVFFRKKKISRRSAGYYGVNMKEFVGGNELRMTLFHPVKL